MDLNVLEQAIRKIVRYRINPNATLVAGGVLISEKFPYKKFKLTGITIVSDVSITSVRVTFIKYPITSTYTSNVVPTLTSNDFDNILTQVNCAGNGNAGIGPFQGQANTLNMIVESNEDVQIVISSGAIPTYGATDKLSIVLQLEVNDG